MKEVSKWRQNKNVRLGIIISLLILVIIIAFFFEKLRLWMLGIGIVLLAALGMEVSNTDLDLGKLMSGESVEESLIKRDNAGNPIFGATCEEDVYNCGDFDTQKEAQEVYDTCHHLKILIDMG
jgi:hypothetical protein